MIIQESKVRADGFDLSRIIQITFSQQKRKEKAKNESNSINLWQRSSGHLLWLHLAEGFLYAGLKESQMPKATED